MLKVKVQETENQGKAIYCNLVMDEMSIRKKCEMAEEEGRGFSFFNNVH